MDKPVFQKIVIIIGFITGGAFFFGGLLDSLSNAINLIDFKIALFLSCVIIPLYILLNVLIKFKKIPWKFEGNRTVKITGLGKEIHFSLLGALLLLWFPVALNELIREPEKAKNFPVFSAEDKRFNILILSFDRESDFRGVHYDIGRVISRRLEQLNKEDSLGISTYYYTDSLDLIHFTDDDADSMRIYHNADQIIYGMYSLKECEGDSTDKVCFNYRTYSKENLSNTDYKMKGFDGLKDIRNGKGQEDIEYIIYSIASFSARDRGDIDKAIKLFKKIKNYETYPKVLSGLGDLNYYKSKVDSAKYYYNAAIKRDSTDALVWNNLGYIILTEGNYALSRKYLEKALSISQNLPIIFDNAGNLFFILNDFQKSKYYLEKSILLYPYNASIWNLLGRTHRALNDTLREKMVYEEGLQYLPRSKELLASLGFYYQQKDPIKSKSYFESILAISSNDPLALNNLGAFYLKQGDHATAHNLFNKAIAYADNYIDPWINLSLSYGITGDYVSMERSILHALSINDKSVEAWVAYANYYEYQKQYKKAIECYKKGFDLKPTPEIAFYLGEIYMQVREYKNAEKSLLLSYSLNPRNPQVWELLGNVYFFGFKNYNESEKWYLKIIPKAKQSIDIVYYRLAYIYSYRKDSEKTLEFVKKAAVSPKAKFLFQNEDNFKWLRKDARFVRLVGLTKEELEEIKEEAGINKRE